MRTRNDQDTTRRVEHAEAMPDMRPGREVGWIFRDGDARAIERQGDGTRVRSDSPQRPDDT